MVCSINIDETPLRPNVRPAKPKSKRGPVTFFVDIEAPNGRSVKRNLTRGVNDLDDDYEQPPVAISLETLLLSLSLSSTFYWDTPVAFDPITADFFLQQFEVGVGGNIDVPDLELSVDIETTAQASISRAPIVVDLTLPQVTTNKTITFEPIDIGLSLPNLESNIETSVDTIAIDLTLPALSTDKETSFDPISLTMSLPDSQVVSDIYGDLAVVDLSVAGTLDVGININLPASMESAQDDDTPSFDSSLLLDTYSSAEAAYSVRKLSSTYSGPCMKVRKDDGVDTGTDIGFDADGNLNIAAIAAHCGTDNGYIVTWYDQSGNGNDATTTASQPQIYDGTSVITENGKAAIEFTGTSQSMLVGLTNSNGSLSIFSCGYFSMNNTWVFTADDNIASPDGIPITLDYVSGGRIGAYRSGYTSQLITGVGAGQHLVSNIYISGTGSTLAHNGTAASQDTTTQGTTAWNYSGTSTLFRHYASGTTRAQELILYHSDESTNRAGIESDINTYYSIYS